MKKQRTEKPIDEELLMRMMAGEAAGTEEPGTGKEETAVPVEKAQEGKTAETRRRKGRQADYETTFLKGMDIPARYGKPVYVRREYHERIAKISVMLTGGKVSLSAYIDNVLAQALRAIPGGDRGGIRRETGEPLLKRKEETA